MQKDAEPQAGLSEELNVYESPHEPFHKAAELNYGTLQHSEILAHNGKIAASSSPVTSIWCSTADPGTLL